MPTKKTWAEKHYGKSAAEIARHLTTKFENGNREEVADEMAEMTPARVANISLLMGRWLSADNVGTLRILLENKIN